VQHQHALRYKHKVINANVGQSKEETYPYNVIPDGGATKVNVEVGVAFLDAHQTIALHLRLDEHRVFLVHRPTVIHPTHFLNNARWIN